MKKKTHLQGYLKTAFFRFHGTVIADHPLIDLILQQLHLFPDPQEFSLAVVLANDDFGDEFLRFFGTVQVRLDDRAKVSVHVFHV